MDRYTIINGTNQAGTYTRLYISGGLPPFLARLGAVSLEEPLTAMEQQFRSFRLLPGYEICSTEDKPCAIRYTPLRLNLSPRELMPFYGLGLCGMEHRQEEDCAWSHILCFSREVLTEQAEGFRFLEQIFGTRFLSRRELAHLRGVPDFSPERPPERLEHLIVPQLSLAFVSSSPANPFPGRPYRRIRLDAMVGTELLRHSRPRLRFSKKIISSLMEEAVASLAQAKSMHDDLEALYNPYVDFEQVNRIAHKMIDQILD